MRSRVSSRGRPTRGRTACRATRTAQSTGALHRLVGTTDQPRRADQARITVELRGTDTPDEAGPSALRAVAAELGTHHCRLVVLWEEKECTL